MSSVSRSCVFVTSRKADRFWQNGEKHVDPYASVLVTRAAITARTLVEPLIALLPPSSNSIQPSLKASSIRMRGSGFLIPCERNRSSQDSRGTILILRDVGFLKINRFNRLLESNRGLTPSPFNAFEGIKE
jgi:hypothetical protein